MPLPNMSDVLTEWEVPVTWRQHTQSNVDFKAVNTFVDKIIKAVVQPATEEIYQVMNIDVSKNLSIVHSKAAYGRVKLNDQIIINDVYYKVIKEGRYNQYGFCESIVEQIKDTSKV